MKKRNLTAWALAAVLAAAVFGYEALPAQAGTGWNLTSYFQVVGQADTCESTDGNYPQTLEIGTNENGDPMFGYYMYEATATPQKPGKIDIRYVSASLIAPGKDVPCTLTFRYRTDLTVENVNNEKVSLALRDDSSEAGKVILEIGSQDVSTNLEKGWKEVSFDFVSPTAESCYLEFRLTADLVGSSYEIAFTDVKVDMEHEHAWASSCDEVCDECGFTVTGQNAHSYPQEWTVIQESGSSVTREKVCTACGDRLVETVIENDGSQWLWICGGAVALLAAGAGAVWVKKKN